MKTIKELLELKELSRKVMANQLVDFSARFNAKWTHEGPLREWASEHMKIACRLRGILDYPMLRTHLANIDQQYLTKPRAEVEPLHILLEDDKTIVKAWIDYDLDTTLAKFSVRDKESGLTHSDCFDLESRYGRILA